MEDVLLILIQYGYIVLFVGMIVDAVGFPFPGDLFLLAAGYLASQGTMSVAIVIPVAFAAVLVGDSATFAIGKALCESPGRILYSLYCRWTRCTLSSRAFFDRACNVFSTFGKKSIVLSKFMWGTRELIPPLAGLSGMRYTRFLSLDAFGIALWVVTFVLLGKFLGKEGEELFGTIESFAWQLASFFAVGYVLLLALRIRKRKRHGKLQPETPLSLEFDMHQNHGSRIRMKPKESVQKL